MPTVASPPISNEPDPFAPLPRGDWLKLQNGRASAPLAGGVRLAQTQASAPHSGRKPLRRPKGPVPRATRIDPALELNARGQPGRRQRRALSRRPRRRSPSCATA